MKRLCCVWIACLLACLPGFAQQAPPAPSAELTQAIHDLQTKEQPYERAQAAERVGQLGGDQALPALTDALLKDEDTVVVACAEALRQLGDRRAVPALQQALAKNTEVFDSGRALIKALTAFADPAMKEQMLDIACRPKADPWLRVDALAALETLNDPSISDRLLPLIRNYTDTGVSARAMLLAGRFGMTAAVPAMLPAFTYEGQRAQLLHISAARALGMLKDPAAIPALQRLLGTTDPDIRLAALDALAAYRTAAFVATFTPFLHDNDATVRVHAITALAGCGSADAASSLVEALSDTNAGVRAAAANALGGYPAMRPAVHKLLRGGTAERRAAAAQAVGAMGNTEDALLLIDLLADPDPLVGMAGVTALAKLGAKATGAVVPLLKSREPTIRARAAEALGRMKAVEALPVLVVQLGDPVPEVRQWAVFALGEMPDPPLDGVVKGLQDNEPAVRLAAARVVGARHLTVIARLLLRPLQYGIPEERAVAYATLRTLSGKDLGVTAHAWEGWVKEQEAGR